GGQAAGGRGERRGRLDSDPTHDLPVHVLGPPRAGRRRGRPLPRRGQVAARGLGGGGMSVATTNGTGRATGVPPVPLEHEDLAVRRGERSGVYQVVAIHSTALGPALGGVRMWHYRTPIDAIRDALRLARGMTFKAAASGLGLGG